MISGPLSLRLVAAVLGKREEDMPSLIAQDALPVCTFNADTTPVRKVYFIQLLTWINGRAQVPMSADDLEAEINRCQTAIQTRDKVKKQRRAAKKKSAAKQPA